MLILIIMRATTVTTLPWRMTKKRVVTAAIDPSPLGAKESEDGLGFHQLWFEDEDEEEEEEEDEEEGEEEEEEEDTLYSRNSKRRELNVHPANTASECSS
jgi:hypothetical protein